MKYCHGELGVKLASFIFAFEDRLIRKSIKESQKVRTVGLLKNTDSLDINGLDRTRGASESVPAGLFQQPHCPDLIGRESAAAGAM